MGDFRLRVFVSVAKNMSFTKAAKELYLSQPAISKHIHELEEQYKVRLFDRIGSQIQLTHEGEVLREHAIRILDAYKELSFEMNLLTQTYEGELRLGASSTISQYVIPSIIGGFLKKFPDIKLSLLSGNTQEVEKALLNGQIDLGIVEGDHFESGVNYSPYIKDELVIVTHTQSKYASLEEITIDELCKLPVVLREYGSGTMQVLSRALEAHQKKISSLNLILTLGNTESIKTFLSSGNAISVVSIRSILRELKNGEFKIIDCPELDLERFFHFVQKQGFASKNEQLFIRYAEAYKREL
ncbi:MAG: LysR substrate-binding domain-containing protein [Bacteroidales bacterium]